MNDLIKALKIFATYSEDPDCLSPTYCGHDNLMIMGISKDDIPAGEQIVLGTLGFQWSDCDDCWHSYRFGSA